MIEYIFSNGEIDVIIKTEFGYENAVARLIQNVIYPLSFPLIKKTPCEPF